MVLLDHLAASITHFPTIRRISSSCLPFQSGRMMARVVEISILMIHWFSAGLGDTWQKSIGTTL